ncbi:MAG: DUF4258 domain-containing protein [Candidatus Aenigmarchaeota archaeon]|nr:DUF4258 domain-containing protein [Candidatus Aenigmarchaeota archaeon]
MEISYTDHAERQIAERKIPKEIIEATLLEPDAVTEGRFGRKIAQKAIKDRLLRIVYSTENGAYIVITTYYTRQERYRMKK